MSAYDPKRTFDPLSKSTRMPHPYDLAPDDLLLVDARRRERRVDIIADFNHCLDFKMR
jgi:hypothetical protein